MLALAVLLMTLCLARTVAAAPLRIPLHIDYPLLSEALRQQLYAHGGRAELWTGPDACQYLYAENPLVGRRSNALQIETDGFLSLGVAVGGQCLSPLTWSGIVELTAQPFVDGFALKLHVSDVNLYDRDHRKSLLVGHGFDLIKSSVIPPFETFSFDLSPSIDELEGLARMAAAPGALARVNETLASLRLEPSVAVGPGGLVLMLDIEVPAATVNPITVSAAPLKPGEIAAWNAALNNWDAFLLFAIKQVATTVPDPQVRQTLFDILLDSRARLVAALAQPQHLTGPDPVRLLFLDEWTRLRLVVEAAAADGRLGNRALEFLSFISAGDALFALDQAAPALGMRISAGDLRRLARIMAPEATGDPLAYSFDEDPQLRQLFGMPAPLKSPGPLEIPPTEGSAGTEPSGQSMPANPAVEHQSPLPGAASSALAPPKLAASTAKSLQVSQRGFIAMPKSLGRPWTAFAPAPVYGAEKPVRAPERTARMFALGRKLRAVVVSKRNAATYRRELNLLLSLAAGSQVDQSPIDGADNNAWPILVKAAAWQESCWRQFVLKHQRVWYLQSKSDDLGLMQVNKYVWRGFYSLPRLKWDIVYNASAGSGILMRLFSDTAQRAPAHNSSQLVRSTYAAYNGGPEAYNRWQAPHESATLRAIDQAFWRKYRAMAAGQPFDILSCAAGWDRLHAD